jgi:hypothetical protein
MTSLNNNNNNKKISLNLAFESIDSCFGYVDYITSKIRNLLELYNASEVDQANIAFVEVVDLMDLYVQLITKIYRVLRENLEGCNFKDENVQNLEIHLLASIKALLEAREKGDIIMLCDLLEYELVDNLVQWKIKILPELKKLKGF